MFPYYEKNIRFAALSLDGKGLIDYGSCCLVLKDSAIATRATVFEENSFTFCQKYKVVAGQEIPTGFRATWANRYNLAIAKLGNNLTKTTPPSDFSNILLSKNDDGGDFIEVHIYGPIHRKAISRLVVKKPTKKDPDRLLHPEHQKRFLIYQVFQNN